MYTKDNHIFRTSIKLYDCFIAPFMRMGQNLYWWNNNHSMTEGHMRVPRS